MLQCGDRKVVIEADALTIATQFGFDLVVGDAYRNCRCQAQLACNRIAIRRDLHAQEILDLVADGRGELLEVLLRQHARLEPVQAGLAGLHRSAVGLLGENVGGIDAQRIGVFQVCIELCSGVAAEQRESHGRAAHGTLADTLG